MLKIRRWKTFLSPQEGAAKVVAVTWSPNSEKLAVCTVDRVILLFDENGEQRDKFSTKPADSNLGKKSYQVSSLAFSPHSDKIAVGQTDNIIYVYRIGEQWGEKKVISNKFILQSAVTCMLWPVLQANFVFGQADGKVKMAGAKGSKSQTIYGIGSYTVSLALSSSGKGFISGHADGTIVRYFFEDDGSGLSKGPICRHPCPPYALVWASSTILAGGCDKVVTVYGQNGKVMQKFDHSSDDTEKEFMCGSCNPTGHTCVMGSYNRLRMFNYSNRRDTWEEGPCKDIPNLYTITGLSWRKDGSKLAVGSLCGTLDVYDCSLRTLLYKNKYELTYVSISQVIVKNLNSGIRVILKSHLGCEIERVQIMGHDRYLVAHTTSTLLIGDLHSCKLSEVNWHGSGGNEKFFCDNENVCMVFNAGELTIMEYGSSEVLGSVRTEVVNPHLISVRINERKQRDVAQCKKLAYLIDLHTICIRDLYQGATLASLTHDTKIDWLELSETGRKLLFRDKKLRLHIFDVDTQIRSTLLNYCLYVQWVPQSDVVVAQNRDSLCIWYNIDMPDKITTYTLKGEVVSLDRHGGHTEVKVQTGMEMVCYTLDEGLIEFGTAVDDGDFLRALNFLETLELNKETEAMWKTLGDLTLSARQLVIAQRCYAALGDVAKAKYLENVLELANAKAIEMGTPDGTNHYLVQAKLAILNKQFKTAEAIYLEKGDADQAMAMYQELHRWEDAIAVAAARAHPELENLRAAYFQWLLQMGQDEKAGEVREREGDINSAITLYMKAGLPAKAAKLVMQYQELYGQPDLLMQVCTALINAGLYEKAGDLFARADKLKPAMEAYRAGNAFNRAIELARSAYPAEVVTLEEEWGDYLSEQKQNNSAIAHYIEAGALEKGVEAAILARQWTKAIQILQTQDPKTSAHYYKKIAEHYISIKDYKRAEEFFSKAGLVKEIMDMYLKADQWDQAYSHAQTCMSEKDIQVLYTGKAMELQVSGKLREAEKLYVVGGDTGAAISMYKNAKQYDAVVRLVGTYHSDLLNDTYINLAKELEGEGHCRKAEKFYVDGNNWKAAVAMYRDHNLWDDSYRVAKANGGTHAANQVAYLWAKSLGGESAVKLLTKFGLLDAAIEFALENRAFDFAFTIAKAAVKSKLPEIHVKYALFLEDEGKFAEAEVEFVKGNKAKEAVLMHIHRKDWEAAHKVAEQHCPEHLLDVLVGQAKSAFERKNFQEAEALFLQAERPDMIALAYKENAMESDALRIVKEYLPHKLDEFQKEMSSSTGILSYEELLVQARMWEQHGEYARAVDFYLQVKDNNCSNKQILVESWEKAVDLATKFLPHSKEVTSLVCDRLSHLGLYLAAGELMLNVDKVKEALDLFMAGEAWSRARDIAKNVAPRYQEYVEDAYVEYLKVQNNADEMSRVDPDGALKIYSQNGQWEKCLALASQQGAEVQSKYVALYAAQLIRDGMAFKALQLFSKYGCSAKPQNFNIYKHLCAEVYKQPLEGVEGYPTYSCLRDTLFCLVDEISRTPEAGKANHKEFEQHLLVTHYLAARAAFQGVEQLDLLVAKLSTSLLRHINFVLADKAFYEAGIFCRAVGWESMAFIFFNRFLDLSEAIEDGSLDALDNSDFTNTDIPFECPLPETPYMSDGKREEVKEWVLALSMDKRVEQALPTDQRGTFVASLHCPQTGVASLPCVVTGYPILQNKVDFKIKGKHANKEDWNKFVVAMKASRTEECSDVWKFITKWCGAADDSSYSF